MRQGLWIYGTAIAIFLCASPPVRAGEPDTGQTKPDNTKVNKRDRQASEPTAEQQKNNGNDLKLTQQIRKAVIADKSLSTYAHNIKIIVRDGSVTLKGPVRSEAEKKTIESKAQEIAGASNVKSEIEIAPK